MSGDASPFDTAEDACASLEDIASAAAHLLERPAADLAAHGDRLVDLAKALADVERDVYALDILGDPEGAEAVQLAPGSDTAGGAQ